jgi:general secretion pathway protein A
MYESHFGFTGAPFNLNPDPAFFFGSSGHSNALSYLKFGVYQGEGFVVVTGEIGAGKTTLVGMLLSELDRDKIVAAQIVSTQLEAGDLLRSVALAFGITPKSLSKAELIATIEAFLTLLVTENKRALLIVDEAQNLSREAVEELRMLSNFQLGNQALLQSFLVGQPELRTLLTSKPMEQFRQRVIASCHLGPMNRQETRAYVEHRLRQVGWIGNPSFDDAAFDRIHHWTFGIPRRVNLLCNRLLLSAYLSLQPQIDASAVDAVGHEVRAEVGESQAQHASAVVNDAAPAAPRTVGARAAVQAVAADDAAAAALDTQPAPVATPRPPRAAPTAGPLMFVSASAAEDNKMAIVLEALRRHTNLPDLVHVRVGDISRFPSNDSLLPEPGVSAAVIHLDANEASATDRIADVLKRFAPLVDQYRPSTIVVAGCGNSALACSLVASKAGCHLVHIEAGWRDKGVRASEAVNSVLIDRIAEVFYPSETTAYLNLIREGVSEANVEHAGHLPNDDAARKIADHLAAWVTKVASPTPG